MLAALLLVGAAISEDYAVSLPVQAWRNPPAVVTEAEDTLPAQPASTTAVEDSWVVLPVQNPTTAHVFLDSGADPVTPVAISEDYWVALAIQAWKIAQAVLDDEVLVPTPAFVPDEDVYQAPVLVPPTPPPNPWQYGANEDVGPLRGQPDEDWYVSPAPQRLDQAPVAAWILAGNEDVGPLFGEPDEDFWQASPPQNLAQAPLASWLLSGNEDVPPLSGQPDEDFWFPPSPQSLTQSPVASWVLAGNEDVGPLFGQSDEDFWTPPGPQSLGQSPVAGWILSGNEDVGPLRGQPDEDFWAPPPPQNLSQAPIPTWLLGNEDAVPAAEPDEDFWAPPAPQTLAQAPVASWILGGNEDTGPLFGQPEEDAWRAPLPVAAPTVAAFRADDEIIPAQLAVEEEYWQNAAPPTAARNTLALPYLPDPEELPAGALRGQPDEDFYQPPVPPLPPIVAAFIADDERPTPGTLTAEEDVYLPPIPPGPPVPRAITVEDERPTPLTVDDEFWANPVWPSPTPTWVPLFGLADETATFPLDEDFWSPPIPPGPPIIRAVIADDELVPFVPVLEEDGWRTPWPVQTTTWVPVFLVADDTAPASFFSEEDGWLPPLPAIIRPPLVFTADDERPTPAAPLVDEDAWANPTRTVQPPTWVPVFQLADETATPLVPPEEEGWFLDDSSKKSHARTQTIQVPWRDDGLAGLFGEDDYPVFWLPAPVTAQSVWTAIRPTWILGGNEDAPPLTGQPDEDFWQNPVAPLAAANLLRLPYLPDPEEIPAGALHGQPDEDFYLSPIPPPPPIIRPFTADDEITSFLRAEEEYWQNPTAPVPATNFVRIPLLPDPEEIPAGQLRGQPDEDFWQNAVRPVPAANVLRFPYLPDPEEIPAGNLVPIVIFPLPEVIKAITESLTPTRRVISLVSEVDLALGPVRTTRSLLPVHATVSLMPQRRTLNA